MGLLTLSNILLTLGLVYFAYTASSLYQLFQSPQCEDLQRGKTSKCVDSLLVVKRDPPKLEARVAFSSKSNVDSGILLKRKSVTVIPLHFNSESGLLEDLMPPTDVNISIPASVRLHNGTLYVIVGLVRVFSENDSSMPRVLSWDADMITAYAMPKADTVQLLGGGQQNTSSSKEQEKPPKTAGKTKESTGSKNNNYTIPCTHWRKKLDLLITNDLYPLPPIDTLPPEFQGLVYSYRHSDHHYYYVPPIHIDRLVWREKELVKVKPDDVELPIAITIRSSTLGRLRFRFTIYQSMESMKLLGFADHDLDDVKSLFADTSLWLLLLTVFVSTLHLIFDFLAFKNDVSFWRSRDRFSGISTRGIVWRAVSSGIILLYLIDESASLLVTFPMALSLIIEIWKLAKALHIKGISLSGVSRTEQSDEEKRTDAYDAQAMRWLGLLMIPLLIGCAGYSLMYVPHRSWYSWTVASMVNAVYAFGFLFMLPQLFINYRLKSVAHLPWRVFIYRALNTFIDDLFAFIIAMPTAHRIACLRDDVVFVIYLYQRYLYPVDPTRPTEMPDADSVAAKPAQAKKSD